MISIQWRWRKWGAQYSTFITDQHGREQACILVKVLLLFEGFLVDQAILHVASATGRQIHLLDEHAQSILNPECVEEVQAPPTSTPSKCLYPGRTNASPSSIAPSVEFSI